MKFISQIKELEHKKLEVLTNFLNENEEKYGNLSEGELRFLFNKIKIPIRAINYVPPPPIAVQEVPWKPETGWVEEVPYIEEIEVLEDPNL
jgi:hypothetical protein